MADSVDRVFVHALNTVKKIPKTGAARPPPSDRMRLYGLYKQAMEGDIDGVMERPNAYSGLAVDELRREQDKWDAWNAQRGLGRTEAKRRYIESLIETMHTYATTPTANELVAELEFVWNQIKDNHSPSSSGSFRKDTLYGMPQSPRQDEYYDTRDYVDRDQRDRDRKFDRDHTRDHDHDHDHENERQHRRPSLAATASDGGPMKILSPMSEEDEAERENRIRMIEEELEAAASADDGDEEEEDEDGGNAAAKRRRRGITTVHNGSQYGAGPGGSRGGSQRSGAAAAAATAAGADSGDVAKRGSQRWSKMMERAMVKLSAEIAALREQITSGREFRSRREKSPVAWFGWLAWALFKHVTLDLFVLALVLLWMRRRKDRRLEDHVRGALRVLREYIRKILPSR
ncbi:Acyl CoA binding protein [Sporothrix schenckii 1099-18]|uniref:Acyl CoA binding protein n=1 Tax=Sporothrix schenckii 1099-18 TaxID=1397361 RepID=A0A0F2MEP8_SPOSC|nr:Acyl CoA binding protein [Sporothrix schenckii 1099-18]KJR87330.1 Acyl CoA binding protein [Sporothrix schenckii 1099-18]